MTLRETVASDLRIDERFVSHAYQDSEGFWTIGYGRLIDKRRGGGISKKEADYLLRNNIDDAVDDLNAVIPEWRDAPFNVQRALINMAFNLGRYRLSGFKKMLAAVKSQDYELAAIEALDSKWARQVGDRALRIADMFNGAA